MSLITVGISDLAVGKSDSTLVTYALGSCVGICLYDQRAKIGGLAHIMLPCSKDVPNATDNYKKFADTGIYLLAKEMVSKGADFKSLTAKIAGGAQMFASANSTFNIGERNVNAVKQVLGNNHIQIIAEQTGSNIGRTIFFNVDTGMVEVKSAMKGVITI